MLGELEVGAVVRVVLWFNTLAGLAYVTAGLGLRQGRGWAYPLWLAGFATTLLVFAVFGLHVARGGAFEIRTVVAMALRSAVWGGIALVARQAHCGRQAQLDRGLPQGRHHPVIEGQGFKRLIPSVNPGRNRQRCRVRRMRNALAHVCKDPAIVDPLLSIEMHELRLPKVVPEPGQSGGLAASRLFAYLAHFDYVAFDAIAKGQNADVLFGANP